VDWLRKLATLSGTSAYTLKTVTEEWVHTCYCRLQKSMSRVKRVFLFLVFCVACAPVCTHAAQQAIVGNLLDCGADWDPLSFGQYLPSAVAALCKGRRTTGFPIVLAFPEQLVEAV
jgi:hypothetical protein